MDENQKAGKEPLPGRMEALRNMPGNIMQGLTKNEIQCFLFEEVWPDSLKAKLMDYLDELVPADA